MSVLGISKAVVSQQVARLEEEIGTTLLVRTTRKVYPTEAGRAFHTRCAFILREAEEAFGELGQAVSMPTGTLRVTAPFDYGISRIVPAVIAFTRKYPACKVDLSLGDRSIDFVAEGFDMAIRVGWLVDSDLQARRIGSFRQLLVCAQELRHTVSPLDAPDELEALPFVANKALREPLEWHLPATGSKADRFICRRRYRPMRRWPSMPPCWLEWGCPCCPISLWLRMWPPGASFTCCPNGLCHRAASMPSFPQRVTGRPRSAALSKR
jgi:DNA-binding transcriptional LysR family regulator